MKILILEDEEVLSRLYAKALLAVGHEVVCVTTSAEALDEINDCMPDLLLVDHGLRSSKLNGLKFVKIVKKFWPNLGVIMLTNFDHQSLRDEARDAGVQDYLVKLEMPPRCLPKYLER